MAALALRVRLGGPGATPRSLAWGRTVRSTALIGLALQAMMSCVYLAQTLSTYGLIPLPYLTGDVPIGEPASAERLWHLAKDLASVLWIVGYVALVRGRPRIAKIARGPRPHLPTPCRGRARRRSPGTSWSPRSPCWPDTTVTSRPSRHPARLAALPLVAGAVLFLVMTVLTWAMAAFEPLARVARRVGVGLVVAAAFRPVLPDAVAGVGRIPRGPPEGTPVALLLRTAGAGDPHRAR